MIDKYMDYKFSDGSNFRVHYIPNLCPWCQNSIMPEFRFAEETPKYIYVMFQCPHHNCKEIFNFRYHINGNPEGISRNGNLIMKTFSENINKVSTDFPKIYNHALIAEQNGLDTISGVGYRKALEFIIKDYLITKQPKKEEEIKSMLLGKCINEFIDDTRMKSSAKRAVWLGNDETHYVKKWNEKSIVDLKLLIDLTLHWIEMEILSSSIEVEMPDK